MFVEYGAGERSLCFRFGFRRQHADALVAGEEERPGPRIEGAHLPFELSGGPAPIELRLLAPQLRGIGYAPRRRRGGEEAPPAAGCGRGTSAPRAPPSSASSISRPPSAASASVNSPAVVFGPIGRASCNSIGPVSSPRSICMMVIPVSRSPARIARWIGAAPRQRGNSEACTL